MPAAAVIPTPKVSMVDAAVKGSVVVDAIKRWRLKPPSLLISSGTDREHGIGGQRMKSQDPTWTNGGESDALRRVCGSRTKARVSKVIRHRCSSSSKRCRQCRVQVPG